jgi:predicted HAD superfamily Cof-like phosphohydrolase
MTNFQKAIEFNKSFGVFTSDTLVPNLFDINPSLSKLRLSLIQEEIGELHDAFKTFNFTEVIDALADILVVVYGAGASYGINLDTNYRDLMNEINGENNYQLTRNFVINFKCSCNNISLPDHMTNIFTDFIENIELKTLLYRTLNNMTSYSRSLENAHNDKDIDKYSSCLLKILEFTYTISCLLGIDIQEAYRIVHDSNMSKLCTTEEIAKETVEWYKKNESRYDTPSYKKSNDCINWIVYNESTGKILKSVNYIPANFESLFSK